MIVFRTLMIGLAGGALAWAIGVPAPWLAGSLVATLAAVGFGFRLALPDMLRKAAFILLGLQTGLSVTPETLERARQWPLSILGLALTVAIIVWACMRYFERVAGWSRASSLFASLPGALSLVLLLAENSQADMRRVVVAQCVRLVLLVVCLPFIIQLIAPAHAALTTAAIASPLDMLLMAAAATVGGLLLERLKVPAGLILGACLASAALALTGVLNGAAPDMLLIPANVVLGVMIGLRIEGTTLSDLRAMTGASLLAFMLALGISVVGAIATTYFTSLPLALTLLAFAPGGLEAMTIMAFALNLDPAFVAAHQVFRYVGLVLFMPWVTRMLLGASLAEPRPQQDARNDKRNEAS